MALVVNYNVTAKEFADLFDTETGRGLQINNMQCEVAQITKATGDTTGTLTTVSIDDPIKIVAVVIRDSAGAAVTTQTTANITFAKTGTRKSFSLTSLGNWTVAHLYVQGRSIG